MADYKIMKAVEYDKLPVKFKKAHPFADLPKEGYLLQKKYDGCMGVAYIHPTLGQCRMTSRTGEDYSVSCADILDHLWHAAWAFFGEGFEPRVFIGEVWQPIEEATFPEISGKFRRQSGSDPDLRFVLNDVLPYDMDTDSPYEERLNLLHAMSVSFAHVIPSLMVAMTLPMLSAEQANSLALQWQSAGGYDGAILRNPGAGYTVGTVKNGEIIKVKPVMSLDLKVDEVLSTIGVKTGRTVWTIGVTYRGVRSYVGSGVPHDFTLDACNQVAEIECLGITEDGKLREPRFKGLRHDKLEPDA